MSIPNLPTIRPENVLRIHGSWLTMLIREDLARQKRSLLGTPPILSGCTAAQMDEIHAGRLRIIGDTFHGLRLVPEGTPDPSADEIAP